MQDYNRIFPPALMEKISAVIDNRLVSVNDITNRKQKVLPHYKVGSASEISSYLVGCLLTLSNDEKQQLIEILEKLKSN